MPLDLPALSLTSLEDRLTPATVNVVSPGNPVIVVVAVNGATTGTTTTNGLTGIGLGNTPFTTGFGTTGFNSPNLLTGSTGLTSAGLTNGTSVGSFNSNAFGANGINTGGFTANIGGGLGVNNFGNNFSTGTSFGSGFGSITGSPLNANAVNSGFTNANLGTAGGTSTSSLLGSGFNTGTNGIVSPLGTNGLSTTATSTSGLTTATSTANGVNAGSAGTSALANSVTITVPAGGTTAGGATVTIPAPPPDNVVRVLDSDGSVRFTVTPFAGYSGPLRTATADVNGDGTQDIVVSAGTGGGPRVAVIDGRTGTTLADFFAYDDNLRNGVYVGAGDLTGDGRAEIVTGAGDGGGPRVRAFQLNGTPTPTVIADFFAFDSNFRGGATVAVGDPTGTGAPQIVAGAGTGGGPRVDTFDRLGNRIGSTFVGDPAGRNGVAVGGVTLTNDGTPVVVSANGQTVRLFDATTGNTVRTLVIPGGTAANGQTEVSVFTGTGGQPLIRVSRTGLADVLLTLDGTQVA